MTTVMTEQHVSYDPDHDLESVSARSERGAIGTEMAIVVAIVVAIALALGLVMRNSATSHQACIPATPGAAVPAGCATSN